MKENILIIFGKQFQFKERNKKHLHVLWTKLIDYSRYNIYFGVFNSIKWKCLDERIEIVDLREYFKENSWTRSRLILDKIHEKYQFDKIVMISRPLVVPVSDNGAQSVFTEMFDQMEENDIRFHNFNFMKNVAKRYFIDYHLCNKYKIPLHVLIYDPLEPDYREYLPDVKTYFSYSTDLYKFFPYAEYGVFKDKHKKRNKEYDFVLGYSVVTPRRNETHNMIIDSLTNMNVEKQLCIKNKFTKEDTSVDAITYMKYLAQSKFTMCIPSYHEEFFSNVRFFEALSVDCIPLVLDKCNYKVLLKHYPDLLEIVEKYCIVSANNIEDKIKTLKYDEILSQFKDSYSIKNLKSDDFYIEYVENFLNGG